MKRINDHIRDRLLRNVDDSTVGGKTESMETLHHTEWSPEFESLMRNRLLMGRFRYGTMHGAEKANYDNISSAIKRLKLWQETGNDEHLVDVANLCLIEFEIGVHPDKHFEAADDGVHTEKL